MVFGADKKLVPQVESGSAELVASGTFKGINSYGNMINAPGQQASDGGASGLGGAHSTSGGQVPAGGQPDNVLQAAQQIEQGKH